MEKKRYIMPTVSFVGPDVDECLEVNVPVAAAVAASVAASAVTAAASRVW